MHLIFTTLVRLIDREANAENIDKFMQRGRDLWQDIYAPHDVKLANKLGSYHPDFPCKYQSNRGLANLP